jgi:hypothetical protein
MTRVDKWSSLDEWIANALIFFQLQEWEITVSRDAAEIDAHADIDVSDQRNSADLRVQRDFFDQSPEKQRLVLCHEIGHIITSRTDRVFENLEEPLGKIAWAVAEPNYLDATERMVEHWARLVAPMLPLPEFPKK